MSELAQVKMIRSFLEAEGFRCEADVDLGAARAAVYGGRKMARLIYPYFVHCYVMEVGDGAAATPRQVVAAHALALAHMNGFMNTRSRWLRLRVPITLSVLLASHGATQAAVEYVHTKKPRDQSGNVNVVALADLQAGEHHQLDLAGFIGVLPLWWTRRFVHRLVDALREGDRFR